MACALLSTAGVRSGILASAAFALGACSSGTLGGLVDPGRGTSPGTVTLRFDLPTTTSFCDPFQYGVCTGNRIVIETASGQPLRVDPGACPLICSSQCVVPPCGDGICLGGGQVVPPVERTWDGSYYLSPTCGQGVGCLAPTFAPPGHYIAHVCVTPGMIGGGDGGQPSCTATGPQECLDVPFDLPGPSLVEATLP